jgi:hypothetical protein
MKQIAAVIGLGLAATLVAYIAGDIACSGVSGHEPPYRICDCPVCGRRAMFHGPDRKTRGRIDWAWFDCDGCGTRFIRYDEGRIGVPDRTSGIFRTIRCDPVPYPCPSRTDYPHPDSILEPAD